MSQTGLCFFEGGQHIRGRGKNKNKKQYGLSHEARAGGNETREVLRSQITEGWVCPSKELHYSQQVIETPSKVLNR